MDQTQVLWKESKLLLTAGSSPQPLILVFMMNDAFSLLELLIYLSEYDYGSLAKILNIL